MKNLRIVIALVAAAAVGALAGNVSQPRPALAATNVLMWCLAAQADGNGHVNEQCSAAPGDTSGLTNVSLSFTSSGTTPKYPLGATATVILP